MSLVRRLSGILVSLLSVVFLTTCAASNDASVMPAPGGGGGNPCSGAGAGESNRQAPIVCVDDSSRTLSVSPEPVHVHNVMASDRKSPVMVHWYTRSGGGDLRIDVQPGCVTNVQCDGRGHCSARSNPRGSKNSCKYDVWVTGGNHDRLDPTIVVDDCCS